MALRPCPACGKKIPETSCQCIYCGYPFVSGISVKCNSCGEEIDGSSEFCIYCGCPVYHLPATPIFGYTAGLRSAKKRIAIAVSAGVAALLAVSLAVTGAVKSQRRKKIIAAAVTTTAPQAETTALPVIAEPPREEGTTEEQKTEQSGGVSAELKELLDEYEEFYGEYAAFLEEYSAGEGDILNMPQEYLSYLNRLRYYTSEIAAIDKNGLSAENLAYYVTVMRRVAGMIQ